MTDGTTSLERMRSMFPGVTRQTYLNAAAQSLLPIPVVEAMNDLARTHSEFGINGYPTYLETLQRARAAGGRLLGVAAEQIAFVGSTTSAISQLAGGIDWRDGDEVLVGDVEFPAVVLPWLAQQPRGARVRFVPSEDGRLPAERLLEAIGPRTRVVAVSHVQWTTGYRMELEELGRVCREREILFCVDAIQSLGVLPVDVQKLNIAVLAADGRKWMMGPQGCTLLYVHPDWSRRLQPPAVGTSTLSDPDALLGFQTWERRDGVIDMIPHLRQDAGRFETGFHNFVGLAGIASAMECAESFGRPLIQKQVLELSEYAVELLQEASLKVYGPLKPNERAGIVTFTVPGDPEPIYEHLNNQKISISLRQGRLRISAHAYNTRDEVQHCVAEIRKALE